MCKFRCNYFNLKKKNLLRLKSTHKIIVRVIKSFEIVHAYIMNISVIWFKSISQKYYLPVVILNLRIPT